MGLDDISECAEDEGGVDIEDRFLVLAIWIVDLTDDEGMFEFFALFLGERIGFEALNLDFLLLSALGIILAAENQGFKACPGVDVCHGCCFVKVSLSGVNPSQPMI